MSELRNVEGKDAFRFGAYFAAGYVIVASILTPIMLGIVGLVVGLITGLI